MVRPPEISVYVNGSPGVNAVTVRPGKAKANSLSTGEIVATVDESARKVDPCTIKVGSRVIVGKLLVQPSGMMVVNVIVKTVGVLRS